MFEDFEFEEKYNPWDVQSLEEFHFYCCPECDLKEHAKDKFVKHALDQHPHAKDQFSNLIFKMDPFEDCNDNIDDDEDVFTADHKVSQN